MSGGITGTHIKGEPGELADDNARDVAILNLQAASAVLTETIQDTVGAMVVGDGSTVTAVYDDTKGTVTLSATGTGSGSTPSGQLQFYPQLIDPLTDPQWATNPPQDGAVWICPGTAVLVLINGAWVAAATYDPTKDPTGGGGGSSGVVVAFLDHPTLTQGSSGSIQLTATGATGAYTWATTALPAGMTLNSTTGVISGTPTIAGSYFVTATATAVTSVGAFTPPTKVGSGGRNSAGTAAIALAVSATVAVGDLLNVCVQSSVVASLNANWTATDNLGNTWANDISQVQATSAQTAILSSRAANAGALTTVTITPGNSTSNITAVVTQTKGVLASGTFLDKTSGAGGTSASVTSGATATTTGTTDLAIACGGTFQSAGTITVPSPWIQLGTYSSTSGTNDRTVSAQYQILSANAAVTATETTATSGVYSMCVATYKPGTGTVGGGGATGSKGFTIVVNANTGPGTAGQYAALGVNSVGGNATQTDGTPGFSDMKTDLGTWLKYGHVYYPGTVPTDWKKAGSDGATINGLGLQPFITATNTDVAGIMAGNYDAAYKAFAQSLPVTGSPIVCLQHEPDHASKFTVANFTSTFNHIAAILRAWAPSNVLIFTQFVAVNVTNGYPYAAGLNTANFDGWGLDCYPSKGQTLAGRVGPHFSYLTAIASKPLIFPEVGFIDDGLNGDITQQARVLESLKWLKSVSSTGVLMYFVGQAGNASSLQYGLTNTQWQALKTSLDAGA